MSGPRGARGFLTDEEKANMPKVSKELLFRIFSYLKPYKLQFAAVFVTIVISAEVGLFPSIITGKIVDQALAGKDLGLLIKLLILAFAALTASQLIGVLESWINNWISQQIIYDMKNQMYRHLQFMPHSFFTTEKQGDIITRMNTDISGVSSVISDSLSEVVSNVATLVTTMIALFSMSWKLAIVGMIIIPFLVIPTKVVGKSRFNLLTKSQAKNDEMNQVINETLSVSGSMLVKIFTREDREYENFKKLNSEVKALNMKESQSGRLFRVVMGMFTQVGPLLIYFAGGLFIIKNIDPSLTVGTITAVVALINRLYRPVESLLNVGVTFTRSLALFTRIFDYFDRENSIVSPENGKKPAMENADIQYEHVAFSYNPDIPFLTDISFTIPAGKMYAIVGPSGSGKSTIVNLIPRLYDALSGSVKIAGVDVKDMDLTYLRQNIGVVTQETYLFNGTIRDNLLYAKEDATQEEIERACRIASIHDTIMGLTDGYDTVVGNRGFKLSGGEKQRISIARTILKDPKILILDEATSALDSISENAIQDALEAMMEGRTSVVIAHRLSTILKADAIMVINNGVIEQCGTHEELLEQGGTYKQLYETQFKQVTESKSGNELNLETLSTVYTVKRLDESDVGEVYGLCRSNARYYRKLKESPRRRNLTSVITELPEGAEKQNKYFAGFYDGEELVAFIDLITGYPENDDAWIGWFMVDAEYQNQGVGSQIIADVRAAMKAQGYDYLSFACYPENEDAIEFWKAQGFEMTEREVTSNGRTAKIMERSI